MTKVEVIRSWMATTYPDIDWSKHYEHGYQSVNGRYFIIVDIDKDLVLFPKSVGKFGSIRWNEANFALPDFFELLEKALVNEIVEIRNYNRKCELIS
jgi:hypothetical protein